MIQLLIKRGAKITDREEAIRMLKILMVQDPNRYREMYQTICSLPLDQDMLVKARQRLHTESIDHALEIGVEEFENYPLDNSEQPVKTSVWMNQPYWLGKMRKANAFFKTQFNDLCHDTKLLDETLLFAQQNVNAERTLQRIRSGQPTILLTGYIGHAVSVLIWGNYFVLCNRGGGSRRPIEVYNFDPSRINISSVVSINEATDKYEEDYKKLFYETLPKELGFEKKQSSDFPSILESCCPCGYQTIGNCSHACLEEAVWAFNALARFVKEGNSKSIPQCDVIATLQEENKRFASWRAFNQLYHLERCLRARIIRPAKRYKDKPLYKLDVPLINRAFSKLNRNVDKRVVKIADQLETYLKEQTQSRKDYFLSSAEHHINDLKKVLKPEVLIIWGITTIILKAALP